MLSVVTSPQTWTIAQIADEFGVTHRTVRHYEELGLLRPERRGSRRVYHRRDRTRLGLILRGKRLGFPLEEIRTIIELYDAPRGKVSQLEYVLRQIGDRRSDLEQRRRDLDEALSELDGFEARCQAELAALANGRPDEDQPDESPPGASQPGTSSPGASQPGERQFGKRQLGKGQPAATQR